LDVRITLVGGGTGRPQEKLTKAVDDIDPEGRFVVMREFLQHPEIMEEIKCSDIFVFASSCENMPNTLLEGMSAGIPIACSDRGPMPEVLKDAGVYFDPENIESIANAIETLISIPELAETLGVRAQAISKQFTWKRTGDSTWQFFLDTFG
jgi:glycosyltransferase involved in cell wall biosynthesis